MPPNAVAAANAEPSADGAVDPVCGMRINVATAKYSTQHGPDTYYFCSAGCHAKFLASPDEILAKAAARAASSPPATQSGGHAQHRSTGASSSANETEHPAGTLYTCPMHPEVQQIGPGSCPICGMALEPELATTVTAPNPELADMTWRFQIGLALTLPILALDMGAHAFGWHPFSGPVTQWIELVLALPVVIWIGEPFFARAWSSILTRNLNMFTLIAMGTGVATLYSVAAILAPSLFPPQMHAADGTVPVYLEAAAAITILVALGQVLELSAREQTSRAIRSLMDLTPKHARRLTSDSTEQDIPLTDVNVGDRLRVRPGEAIPVDGIVTEGSSTVDESAITGESVPVTKQPGETLIGGTLNQRGSMIMRAEKIGRDTVLANIVQLVSKAQRSRASVQRIADRVSGWFVPVVIAVALLAFVAWLAFGPEPQLPYALITAVSVLIIACPCALGLATPMSIMVGVGRGAESGIFIRDAAALERLANVDTFVFDKTGTLTQGRPELTAIEPVDPVTSNELLRYAASLEQASEHPLSLAIVAAAQARAIALTTAVDFHAVTGQGVTGVVEGHRIAIGNAQLMTAVGVDASALAPRADTLRATAATVMFTAIDGKLGGLLAVTDPIKNSSLAALAQLRAQGLRILMLTGDNRDTARAVARQLAIADVEADLLPADKIATIERLKKSGHVVAMVGDGINDAPALAAADVGIAIGTGSDIAIQSAGITLLSGDLTAVVKAQRLARATMRNIRQNLAFAMIYNGAGVPIAAGVLYPLLGILLSPSIAAAAMTLSSISVVLNALRLRRLPLS